uniref:ULP_PROTEASE domain-containing protein n=1 Tax=Caenorhabditis tropicalis TaxID=1561998 RepID=A0A1I7TWB7_9PELO
MTIFFVIKINLKEENPYKSEEKLICCTKRYILSGVDVEELKRKRVELHTDNFRDVCLPFNNSLDVQSWGLRDVLEMASQFMGANEVEILMLVNCDGKMLDQPMEELFLKLNEEKAIFSWRSFRKLADMMEQLKESIARNARGVVVTEGSSDRPAPSPSEKTFEEKGIQVDPIETVVDKLETGNIHVEVGGKRRAMTDLLEQRVERWGAGFNSVALPFSHSIEATRWTHEQLVEVVAQFLPNAAAHAIDSIPTINGYSKYEFCETSKWGKSMFRDLNLNSANISVAEFLKVKKNFNLQWCAQRDWEKEKARQETERVKELERLEGLYSIPSTPPAESKRDTEPPVKRSHVEKNPKPETGSQTDVQTVEVKYKPEELICSTKDHILAEVDLDDLHQDILEMTSQFMMANEVEGFKLAGISGWMLVLSDEDIFLNLNQKKAIFSWRRFKKFVDMMDQMKIAIARSATRVIIARRSLGLHSRNTRDPVINSGSSYSPFTVKTFEEKGIQSDPIETVVDKVEEGDVHVEVGGKRHGTIELSEKRVKSCGAGFSSVALPFDHSFENENWTHEQFVEVVAQFLPNAAVHAIDSQPLVGCSFHRFYLDSPEGMELFKDLNLNSANISGDEFVQVGKYFESLLGARQDYAVKQKEKEQRNAEQGEAEQTPFSGV